jgi:hypothetical protein
LLVNGCGGSGGGVQVNETGTEPANTIAETIRLNNCGGKADAKQIAGRSSTVNIEGAAQLGVGYQILQANVSAKYAEYKTTTKNQELTAPPGTNMEFVLAWTEQGWVGNITAEDKSGTATYRVRVPIAVELVSSRDLGCGLVSQPPTTASQPTVQPPATSAPVSASQCPQALGGVHLGAGKGFKVTLLKDCYYHFNVACAGCQAGEENNYIIRYNGTRVEVTVPEGSVWQYSRVPNKGEVCSDTRDHYPTTLPSFLNVLGVEQLLLCN